MDANPYLATLCFVLLGKFVYDWWNRENPAQQETVEKVKPVNGTSGALPPSFWQMEFRKAVEEGLASHRENIRSAMHRMQATLDDLVTKQDEIIRNQSTIMQRLVMLIRNDRNLD